MEMKTCVSEFLRLRRRQQGRRCQTRNVSRFASNDVFPPGSVTEEKLYDPAKQLLRLAM